MLFTNIVAQLKDAMKIGQHCILRKVRSINLVCKEVKMTHNQVAYWDMIKSNAVRSEANKIAMYEADTRRKEFLRNEYWTHKNYNWNESMFGYQLFKDLASTIGAFALA